MIMFAQNPYGNLPYSNYQSQYPYQRQSVNQQIPSYPMQPQAQPQPQQPILPQIQDVRYGTEEEARAFIVFPNAIAYFIDLNKGRLYSKTANNAGASSMEYFKLEKINPDGTPIIPQEVTPQIDMGEYIKKSEIEKMGFVTTEQLNTVLSNLMAEKNAQTTTKSNNTTSKSKNTEA